MGLALSCGQTLSKNHSFAGMGLLHIIAFGAAGILASHSTETFYLRYI